MLRSLLGVAIVSVTLLAPSPPGRTSGPAVDFAFLQPWFDPTPDEREQLANRAVFVRALDAEGTQMSVIAVCAVAISPDAFVSRVRTIGRVHRAEMAAGRFSDPPIVDDLAALTLDDGDLDRLRRCQPGDCRLNLADEEMAAIQSALPTPSQAQQAFRDVVLGRVARYRSGGLAALPDYHDRGEPVHPAAIFSEILQRSPFLTARLPAAAAFLARYPDSDTARTESFLHWSKVIMNGKAVVLVNHVGIFQPIGGREIPRVLVVGKQVFASRYMNGELTLTMLFAGADDSSTYLVHVDRSDLDAFTGSFRGIRRAVIERRVRAEAADALVALRDRLERER